MTRRKVLIAAPHYWTSPFQVAGQHLTRAFAAEGWDVAYVSNPISPLHLGRGWTRDLRERFAIYRRGGVTASESIWAYVPGALATPSLGQVLGTGTLLRSWPRLSVPNVVGRLRQHGFGSVDILYVDTVVQGFWLHELEYKRSVLRVGDRMSAFSRFSPAMVDSQRDLAGRVDLVVYSARSLAPDVERLGARRAMHLPNGVDVGHFADDRSPAPVEYASITKPIAVYAGAMDSWFDFAMIEALARQLPAVSFVLIGPPEMARRRLPEMPNVRLLGPRPYWELPAYLRHADVGLIPFDVANHPALVHGIHPLKLYEYLASGLPVVASRWRELDTLGSPALTLCQTADDFAAAITRPRSLDVDSVADFLQRADWRARVRDLVMALDRETAQQ